MSELSFKLEIFEGPLDLLLSLILKHKLDINDIEISCLLEQYLKYIDSCSVQDFELAGEFLEMAARLIYIKTLSLLPSQEEAITLKKELEGSLIEYSLCKETAKVLATFYIGNDIYSRQAKKLEIDKKYKLKHEPEKLLKAYLAIENRKISGNLNFLVEDKISNTIRKKAVSVISKVIYVLRNIRKTGAIEMELLYSGVVERSERVAIFLAILELTKNGRIIISDDSTKIYFNENKGGT